MSSDPDPVSPKVFLELDDHLRLLELLFRLLKFAAQTLAFRLHSTRVGLSFVLPDGQFTPFKLLSPSTNRRIAQRFFAQIRANRIAAIGPQGGNRFHDAYLAGDAQPPTFCVWRDFRRRNFFTSGLDSNSSWPTPSFRYCCCFTSFDLLNHHSVSSAPSCELQQYTASCLTSIGREGTGQLGLGNYVKNVFFLHGGFNHWGELL